MDAGIAENLDAVIADKLDSVDWNFADSARATGIHRIHPYPAKFIREIPKALIELFHPGDQSPVFDPFCGSGTTLVESQLCGLPAIGLDLHPLASLIAKVKTTPVSASDLLEHGTAVLQRCKELAATGNVPIPELPNIDHWFKKDIQICLAALKKEIEGVPDFDIADALRVCFSSIIVRVSNQDSDTRYAALDKRLGPADVWSAFQSALTNTSAAMGDFVSDLPSRVPPAKIITKDILKATPNDIGRNIGLVVTSPPYPNAYEYWLYHKYRMYWLGMDPIAVRDQEIGARPHFFKKNPHTAEDFRRQMSGCFQLLAQVMSPGSYACFVVGRSIIKGQEIDNESLLVRASLSHGFRRIASVGRVIAANRKSFNLSHGTINKEQVVVFSLEQA